MKFELKRKIDELGRIVLPAELRNYYEISSGETVVLLPVRNGIQVAKTDYFHINQLPEDSAVCVDELGRIVIPTELRKQFNLTPKDVLYFVPNETCMLMQKSNPTKNTYYSKPANMK